MKYDNGMKSVVSIGTWISVLFLSMMWHLANSQNEILLDGYFEDWSGKTSIVDTQDDGSGLDFYKMAVSHDEEFLYVFFEINTETILQESSSVVIYVDTDDNPETGNRTNGIGAELVFYFGSRSGKFYSNEGSKTINHSDIGLVALPSFSSKKFEIALDRRTNIDGIPLFTSDDIKLFLDHDIYGGDVIPNSGSFFSYSCDQIIPTNHPHYKMSKHEDSDLRIMSYNVLFDNITNNPSYFENIINAMNPDVIGFQEIYDSDAGTIKAFLESFTSETWYCSKQGNDIILASLYPISGSYWVAGNGAFMVQKDDVEVLLVVTHLPCCENDLGRQEESDAIMEFIREGKNGESSLDLAPNTPYIIMGDMNFVGLSRQFHTIVNGDIKDEFTYGNDFWPDWDNSALMDALLFQANSSMAVTWYSENSSFYPGRLDYAFYTDSELCLKNGFVLNSSMLPLDTLDEYALNYYDCLYASDHFPLVLDFAFEPTVQISNDLTLNTDIDIYPNPVKSELNLVMDDAWRIGSIQLFDNNGTHIFSRKMDMKDNSEMPIILSVEDLNQGIYYLQVDGEFGKHVEKIIIQR